MFMRIRQSLRLVAFGLGLAVVPVSARDVVSACRTEEWRQSPALKADEKMTGLPVKAPGLQLDQATISFLLQPSPGNRGAVIYSCEVINRYGSL